MAIRIGIGGWTFPPWRGTFYPAGLAQTRELDYASRRLGAIEINGTFYRTQTPASFRKWAAETPDDFMFSVKGPRFATHRKPLAEAAPSVERFLGSGVTELGDKLGPLLWQFAPTLKFDPADFDAFLALLPRSHDGRALRHVVEMRHPSFSDPAAVALLRAHGVARAIVDSPKHPKNEDLTADFVYLRLEDMVEDQPTGYEPAALERWAARIRDWAGGGEPADAVRSHPDSAPRTAARDCFVYLINGAKIRAPAAAQALIERFAPPR